MRLSKSTRAVLAVLLVSLGAVGVLVLAETIIGGPFDDVLEGTSASDVIRGLGGNDTIFGLWGSDRLEGGDDNDALFGNEGNDTLDGGDGDDELTGGAGHDILEGGPGDDDGQAGGAADGIAETDTYIIRAGDVPAAADETITACTAEAGDIGVIRFIGFPLGTLQGLITAVTVVTAPVTSGTYTITPGPGKCILQRV